MESMPRQVWAVLPAKGDEHNIRKVVIMLCLNCVYELLLAVICPGEDCELKCVDPFIEGFNKGERDFS